MLSQIWLTKFYFFSIWNGFIREFNIYITIAWYFSQKVSDIEENATVSSNRFDCNFKSFSFYVFAMLDYFIFVLEKLSSYSLIVRADVRNINKNLDNQLKHMTLVIVHAQIYGREWSCLLYQEESSFQQAVSEVSGGPYCDSNIKTKTETYAANLIVMKYTLFLQDKFL